MMLRKEVGRGPKVVYKFQFGDAGPLALTQTLTWNFCKFILLTYKLTGLVHVHNNLLLWLGLIMNNKNKYRSPHPKT